tara:strand:+ start:102 stop:515 length:414 start_codon:yes stop_codon:yes gene_type:complete
MTDLSQVKYAIYDEAVGALTFLEGSSGVSFSGQLNGGSNYIQFPDDWVGKKPPEAVRTIDFNTINVQLTPVGYYQELFVGALEWGNRVEVKNNAGSGVNCFYTVTAQLAVNAQPKNVTRKVKVVEENGNDSHWEEVK